MDIRNLIQPPTSHTPTWLRLARCLTPPAVEGWLEDRMAWHVIRGHHVEHNVIMGEPSGPMRCWDSYCHTCEMAW